MSQSPRVRQSLFVLGGLWLLYLVGINVALLTGLIPWAINQKTLPSAKLGYSAAWSWWPGDLNVRGFHLRVDDHSLRMEIEVDRVEASVALHQLLNRRFQTNWVEAEGASVKVRDQPSLQPWSPKREHWRPHMEPNVQRYLGGPELPPALASDVFWVELEKVHVQRVHTIWIDVAHFVGEAEVHGRLRVLPSRLLDVGPVAVAFQSGGVSLGEDVLLSTLKGRAELLIPDTVLTDSTLGGPLRRMQGHLHLDATTSLEVLDQVTELSASQTAGLLHLDAWIEDGRLRGPTALRWRTPDFALQLDEYRIEGVSQVEAEVNARGLLSARAELTSLRLSTRPPVRRSEIRRPGRGVPFAPEEEPPRPGTSVRHALASAPRLSLRYWMDKVALADEVAFQSLSLDLPAGRVNRLSALPLPDPLSFEQGEADVAVSLAFPDFRPGQVMKAGGQGGVRVRAQGAKLRFTGVPVSADVDVATRIQALQLWPLTGRIDNTHVGLTHVRVDDEKEDDFWGHVVIQEGAFVAKPPRFRGEVELGMKSARPIVGFFAQKDVLPKWSQGLLSVADVKATANVSLSRRLTEVDALHLTAQGTELFARLRAQPQRRDGALLVKFHGLELGVALEESRPKLVLLGAAGWYRSLYATEASR
ncbi:MAG: hypothetical protein ACT4TC_04745 [Myxococcaceae bacterium]